MNIRKWSFGSQVLKIRRVAYNKIKKYNPIAFEEEATSERYTVSFQLHANKNAKHAWCIIIITLLGYLAQCFLSNYVQ